MDPNQLIDGLVFYVVFLFSVTLHEAAHAWAAKRGGDLTAYLGGQVSLDPMPHIRREPFGMVLLPLLSVFLIGWPFGFASAPYDRNWAVRYPNRAAWMALAGPGANLLLVAVAAILIFVGTLAGLFGPPEAVSFSRVAVAEGALSPLAFFFSALLSMNLLLAILNLVPVPPLDGSAALTLLMPSSVVPKYQQFLWTNPILGWVGILVAWRALDYVFQPVWLALVNLIYPGVSYG